MVYANCKLSTPLCSMDNLQFLFSFSSPPRSCGHASVVGIAASHRNVFSFPSGCSTPQFPCPPKKYKIFLSQRYHVLSQIGLYIKSLFLSQRYPASGITPESKIRLRYSKPTSVDLEPLSILMGITLPIPAFGTFLRMCRLAPIKNSRSVTAGPPRER